MKNFTLFILLFVSSITFAQVGIGTTTPDALLDLTSNTKGVLIPRVELTSKASSDPVTNTSGAAPAHATLVFNTATTTLNDNDDVVPGFYYWDTPTLRWVYVGNDPKIVSTTWNLLGNTNTNPATDFIGTTDDQDVVLKRNNLRAGLLGVNNTSFGTTALESNTIGEHNTAVGAAALQSNTIGQHNTAVGEAALQSNTEGEWNTAMGKDALLFNTIGYENTAYGIWALRQNTTGIYNTATGSATLDLNTTGSENTATGAYALGYNETGSYNTATGSEGLYYNTTGNKNTATGGYALNQNTTGNFNTASGFNASNGNSTGNNNTANGAGAIYSNTTGNNNTASGFDTGRYIADGTTPNTTPNNSIFIGANTRAQADNQINQIVIGNDAIGNGSNTVTIGNTDITDNYFSGNVRSEAFIKTGATGTNFLRADGTDAAIAAPVWGSISGTLANQLDLQNALNLKASLASPTFTGTPTLPTGTIGVTQLTGDNSTALATTAFVNTVVAANVADAIADGQTVVAPSQNAVFDALNLKANLASPTFTGTPVLPSGTVGVTQPSGNNSTLLATTAFVKTVVAANVADAIADGQTVVAPSQNAVFDALNFKANLASPTFTGIPSGPTAALGTNSQQFATTAFVLANASTIPHLFYNNTLKTVWNYGSGGGSNNTSFGENALVSNTTGLDNTAYGKESLALNTTGFGNTAIGSYALLSNEEGIKNTAIGSEALGTNVTGNENTAIGRDALYSNSTGNQNTAIGLEALRSNSSGEYNTAIGALTLRSNTIGNYNTAIGLEALRSNTSGEFNTAIGTAALRSNTTGSSNTSIGESTLLSNTGGGANTAVGNSALRLNTSGGNNTAIGRAALSSNTIGDANTAIGSDALFLNTVGFSNTGIGNSALRFNTSGSGNTAIGFESLKSNTIGMSNTSIGEFALIANTSGESNTATGKDALRSNTSGESNTAYGLGSLSENQTGNNNIAIGNNSGKFIGNGNPNTTPSQSIFVGADTKALGNNQSNQIVIGHNAVGNGTNTVTIGNSSITNNYFNGNVRSTAFIKSGGTSNQYLMADGSTSTITASTPSYGYITGTGLQSIPNSTVSELTSTYWNGSATVSGSILYFVGRFTVYAAGFYQISANISFTLNGSGSRSIGILRNNTGTMIGYATQNANSTDRTGMSCSGGIFLNVGDFISVNCYQSSGNSLNMDGAVNGYFSIVKMDN